MALNWWARSRQSSDCVASSKQQEHETQLDWLQQIRRGVKLKPTRMSRRRARRRPGDKLTRATGGLVGRQSLSDTLDPTSSGDEHQDDTKISAILFRVLRKRYLAVQQTDDDDSELSSIDGDVDRDHGVSFYHTDNDDELFLVGYNNKVGCCSICEPIGAHERGLLERFANLDLKNENLGDDSKRALINDLTVRL